ncbi:MAG: helix-turn-helix domain-containing protein [Candidatus Izemoplasmataceae bacterium]
MKTEKILAVSLMQTYIHEHITETITLKNLAKASFYSPYHASRTFKEVIGISPFEYIRKTRLTLAAKTIRDQKSKVIDVALDFLFDSHEGFTRAFTKTFGLSPKRYQLNPKPIKWFLPYNALSMYPNKLKETLKMNETFTIFTQIIERPARKALIKRGKNAKNYFAYCEEVDCEIWGLLTSVKDALYEPVGFWLPKSLIKKGTSEYVQGVEVPIDYQGEIPEGLELITLDPQAYLVFQSESYLDQDFEQAIYKSWEAIKKYDPSLYGYAFDYESAPKCQLEPLGYRGYIEMHPIKKL